MGYVLADIQVKNPRHADLKPMTISARVDTGAMTLRIPEPVAIWRTWT